MERSFRVLILLALALASCATPPASHTPGEGESLALWRDYGDLADLTDASDVIVEATVTRRLESREARGHPAQRVPVAFTESLVRATRYLKGQAAEDLRVVQVGKEGDPANTYPEFPLLRPGTNVVLFLVDVSDEPVHADGSTKYSILGPAGLFTVRGGQLSSAAGHVGAASIDEVTALGIEGLRARLLTLRKP